MSEHLFLGDSTYPHTPAFPTELKDQLRFCAEAIDNEYGYNVFSLAIAKSIDRIEQLERELAEAQKDASRYAWAARNSLYFMELCNGFKDIDDAIDECIAEEKA